MSHSNSVNSISCCHRIQRHYRGHKSRQQEMYKEIKNAPKKDCVFTFDSTEDPLVAVSFMKGQFKPHIDYCDRDSLNEWIKIKYINGNRVPSATINEYEIKYLYEPKTHRFTSLDDHIQATQSPTSLFGGSGAKTVKMS